MAARKPLIAGNWKMFGRRADLAEIKSLADRLRGTDGAVEALICPPAPYVAAAVAVAGGVVAIGAQDCSSVADDAARTGEISAAMLADAGAAYIIVGHSERRTLLGETSELVRAKAESAIASGLTPIVCVGETQAERVAGRVAEVLQQQVRASTPKAGILVVAYEPVWAIGGDRTPTIPEIAEAHGVIRATLAVDLGGQSAEATRILYGGSVGPKNAGDVFSAEGVDGALVGRASLKASDFSAIIFAHPAAS